MSLLKRVTEAIAGPLLTRDVTPLEGTNSSLWGQWNQIENWWSDNGFLGGFTPGNGNLAERTWITNRCLQMNSQQIGSMPLRFEAPNITAGAQTVEPAWVSNPDPEYYPNGISSLIRSLVRDYYGWGWCLLYITSRYANGYPRTFTRIPACRCEPMWGETGRIQYRLGERYLNPSDVIQIDRDCGDGYTAHGSSAIRSYAQLAWGLQAAGNQAMEVNTGGVPKAVLKVVDPNRRMDSAQAEALQTQWQTRTQARGGAPPVMQYGLDFETLGWSPKDMALLETQDFNALALATAFGIPAVLLNMIPGGGRGNSALTYNTPVMAGEQWWMFELRPTAKGIADALSSQALPAGQWVWFDATDTILGAEGFSITSDDPQAADPHSQETPPASSGASLAQQPPQLSVIGG